MTKFTLSTYLAVAVLIILTGVLSVLFMQMDRSYQYPSFSPDLQKEQSDIIKRIYQIQTKTSVIQEEALPITTNNSNTAQLKNSTVIEPISSQPVQTSPVPVPQNQIGDVWGLPQTSEYESEYYLRNNPWSPDYKPGY